VNSTFFSDLLTNFANMKLIADSGSTKTDWVLTGHQGAVVERQHTEGINPIHQSEEDIRRILASLTFSQVESIHFYGSGVRPELQQKMRTLLADRYRIDESEVEAESDLLGAARALCGREEGIVCILGTGANSCLFDGDKIIENTPALGYILGDEGSGAVIGRNLLNAIYKGKLNPVVKEVFEEEMQLSVGDVIQRVYREPLPNRWMASLTYFIYRHLPDCQELSQLVVSSFQEFLHVNVTPYHRPDLPVSAVGSVAWFFRTELAHAASLECMRLGLVMQAPMEGLIRYHCK